MIKHKQTKEGEFVIYTDNLSDNHEVLKMLEQLGSSQIQVIVEDEEE